MNLSSRLAVVMIALVVLTALAVGLLTYRNVELTGLPRALERYDLQAELVATRLAGSVQGLRADVLGFRSAVAIDGMMRAKRNGGVDPSGGTSFAQWRDRMASRFVAELSAKPLYAQYQVIGVADGGRELLRVDRGGPGGAIRVVPETGLQSVGDRPYFIQAIGLPDRQVYVSPIELEPEHASTGMARAPVQRAAAPIYAEDGRPFGIVVITLDFRSLFDQVRATRRIGQVYIVNEQGDYLVHPDPTREFGFAVAHPYRLQDDYPDLADWLVDGHVAPRIVTDRTGAEFGIAMATVQLADGLSLRVVRSVPYAEVIAPARSVGRSSLIAGLGAVLGAVALAILFARSMTRPLVRITAAVETYKPGATISVPTGAGGEPGRLADAIARMSDVIAESTATIRRNAEIFDIVMSSMTDMVILLDENGTLVYVNPATRKLIGTDSLPALTSRISAMTVRPVDGAAPLLPDERPLRRILGGEIVNNLELVYRLPDGRSIQVVLNGCPIRDADGVLKGAVLIARDVTEAKAVEAQLRQSQKLDSIGQLTGGVAHDFNNILTVIIGTAELLIESASDRPMLQNFGRTIEAAATRGSELTKQLLAFARRQPLQPTRTDVNTLIADTTALLRSTLGERIEIEAMLADDAWPANIDASQLGAALVNLAVNARDAMPNGGKLTLETRNVMLDEAYARANTEVRPGPYVMIAVSDTGEGIPEAIRDRVFEPFFTTKDVGKGTGLGLSMVYGFVKQSGGHIKLYSEEGHGTAIKLYLPQSMAAETTGAPAPSASTPGGSETVLVVEDDVLVREHVVAQLGSLGYRTLAAADGSEALALVDSDAAFDLLFTDVIMPGDMNGRQLAEAVTQRRPSVKVLYTSGYTENAIVHHGRLDPGVALLNKPYRKAELAQKVREVLDAGTRSD